ncbi:MAG: hypothetical protein ABI977_21370 [Acidobacteriota bacterium]
MNENIGIGQKIFLTPALYAIVQGVLINAVILQGVHCSEFDLMSAMRVGLVPGYETYFYSGNCSFAQVEVRPVCPSPFYFKYTAPRQMPFNKRPN